MYHGGGIFYVSRIIRQGLVLGVEFICQDQANCVTISGKHQEIAPQ